MKAVILHAPGDVRVQELPVPALSPGDVLVEMQACGLCGSDIEKLQGEYTAAPPVLGHEAVGVVSALGEGVEGLGVEDRVFPHHHVPCYRCEYCRQGSHTMCPDYRRYHLDPGGFAQYFRVPAWNVERGGVLELPSTMTFEVGSFIEPLACCIRAVERVQVQGETDALVVGGGPMGLLLVQLLPLYGVKRVLVSEPSPKRLDFAKEMGAAALLNPLELDVASEVHKLTDGRGADVVFLASGNPKALAQSVASVRSGGRVGLVGIPERGTSLQGASQLVTREISLVSSNAATEVETKKALDLLDKGRVKVDTMVTHKIPLADFAKAVELASEGDGMKVLITP